MEIFGLKPVLKSVSSFLLSIILGIMLFAIIFSKDTYASEFKLSEGTLRQYRESSKRVAGTVADSKIEGMFQNDLDSSEGEELRKNLSSYKGANVADAGLDIKKAEDKGVRQRSLGKNSNKIECTEDSCELGSIYSSTAVNKRDIAMEEVGFKKDEDDNIIDNKGYLDRAKKITKEASGKFDFIKGEYRGCEGTVTENVAIIKESCDQYYDAIHNSCPINQVVEIDPRYVYQCSKKRDVREKVCNEYVKTRCDRMVDCGFNTGGIVEGTVDTGIEWNYSYPYLRLGNKTPSSKEADAWHFNCGSNSCCDKKKSSARLKIKDIKNVKNFKLHKISYDDHAQIKINGVVVHNTLGGSYLEITNRYWGSDRKGDNDRIIASGANSGPCWRLFTNEGYNHYDYVGKDIKHYLREGVNEIEIELVYSQLGQVNVEFEAEQYCCDSWNDKSEVKCKYVK